MNKQTYKCFKKTSDNWWGNYYKELVEVKCLPLDPEYKDWRVLVSGNDDFRMIKDFEDDCESNEKNALSLLLEVMSIEVLTQKELIDKGFEWF